MSIHKHKKIHVIKMVEGVGAFISSGSTEMNLNFTYSCGL